MVARQAETVELAEWSECAVLNVLDVGRGQRQRVELTEADEHVLVDATHVVACNIELIELRQVAERARLDGFDSIVAYLQHVKPTADDSEHVLVNGLQMVEGQIELSYIFEVIE